jgi:hypothetical protein
MDRSRLVRTVSRAAGLLGLAVVACTTNRTTGVLGLQAGSYLMASANGHPAPAVIHTTTDPTSGRPMDIIVVADTMVLGLGDSYQQHAWIEARIDGTVVSTSRWFDHGFFTVQGSTLHFTSDFIQNVAFDGVAGGFGGLTVTQNLAGEGTAVPYLFQLLP